MKHVCNKVPNYLQTQIAKAIDKLNYLKECTYEILERARRKKYGKTYLDKNDSLLTLDRTIHVPNDVQETMHIAQMVLEFAKTLAKLVSKKHPELDILEVKMNGSFVNDTKVGDINDFNFLCIVPSPNTTRHTTSYYKGKNIFGIVGPEVFYETVKEILKPLIDNTETRVRVEDVFYNEDRTFVLISWLCPKNHLHEIQFDLAMACERDTALSEEIDSRVRENNSWLRDVKPYLSHEKVTQIVSSNQRMLYTSSVFEGAIHDYLKVISKGRAISLIRCVKFLSSIAFPELIVKSNASCKGYTATSYVNSYIISRLIFQNWSQFAETMSLEDVKLLMRNIFGRSYPRPSGETWLDVKDPVTGEMLSTSLKDLKYIDHADVIKVFDSPLFQGNARFDFEDETIVMPAKSPIAPKSYFRVRGRYHEAGVLAEYCSDSPMCLYTVPDTKTMPCYEHPLVHSLIMYRQKQINSDIGVNLSLINIADFYLKWKEYCSEDAEYEEFQQEYK